MMPPTVSKAANLADLAVLHGIATVGKALGAMTEMASTGSFDNLGSTIGHAVGGVTDAVGADDSDSADSSGGANGSGDGGGV